MDLSRLSIVATLYLFITTPMPESPALHSPYLTFAPMSFVAAKMGLINIGHKANPILTRIAEEDKVRWWKKRNLRLPYLLLYPTCMGIQITSGFDSQMINGLQLVSAWNKC